MAVERMIDPHHHLNDGVEWVLDGGAHQRVGVETPDKPLMRDAAVGVHYLITKGGAYYRPNAQGYTRDKAEAGRFTLAEAISHSHPNGPDGPRDGVRYEVAPVEEPAKGAVGDFRGWLVRSIRAAQFVPDALDPVAAETLSNVLARFDATLNEHATPSPANAVASVSDEQVAFAIIEGSAGERAAAHAKEFKTANWEDALRSARQVAALQAQQNGGAK